MHNVYSFINFIVNMFVVCGRFIDFGGKKILCIQIGSGPGIKIYYRPSYKNNLVNNYKLGLECTFNRFFDF